MGYKLLEDEPEERGFQEKVQRQGARALASTASGLIGSIGDIANLASQGAEKIGLASPEGAQKFREKTLTTDKSKELLQEQFPTLKPENEVERFSDDVFDTLGSLASPGGIGKTFGTRLLRKFGLALGSNLGKEVVDQVAAEEGSSAGQYTKAGLLFFGSLINPKAAAKAASEQYKTAESFLPSGAVASTATASKKLDALESSLTKGRPLDSLSGAQQFVIKQIDKVRSLFKNGSAPVEQLHAQKKSLYEDLDNLYAEFGKEGAKTAKNEAKKVPKIINETLEEYGKTNPKYYEHLKKADEMYGAIASSKGAANWVNRTFPSSPWSRAGLLFGEKAAGLPLRMGYKAYKSPEIRKLYGKAIALAAKEDAKEFAKIMDQLDKKLIESESKDRYKFID